MSYRIRLALIALVLLAFLPGVTSAQFQPQQDRSSAQPTYTPQPAAPSTGTPVIRSGQDSSARDNSSGQRQPDDRARQGREGELAPGVPDPRFALPRQPAPRSEFQDFVENTAGRQLPFFGHDLFREPPSTFAPLDRVPVTPDYVIGPGDELVIRAWGQIDVDVKSTVDRNGTIYVPQVGGVNVAGVKFQDLHNLLRTAFGRVFRQFELTVSLGQLRSIQIFVVGQANRPGSYTVSAFSTLVNALFASGGPSTAGSMRRIQLKRGSTVVSEFDIYDLLLKGDKSKDTRLLAGDVIFIPPVGPLVAISGSINAPAVFELKDKTSLASLIQWAGGLATTAAGQKVTVERIEDRKSRKVDEFALGKDGLARQLNDGDLVTVYTLSPRFDNAVTLRGHVAQPARLPWQEGMRVRDLIPNREALIAKEFWINRNALLIPDNWITSSRRATRDRQQDDRADRETGSRRESERTERDRATDRAVEEAREGRTTDARRDADRFDRADDRYSDTSGGRLSTGPRRDTDRTDQERLRTDIKRYSAEINWDYAVIERLKQDDLTTTLIPFNLGKAVLEGQADQNLVLQPGDVVTIFSKDDIQVPVSRRTQYVRLEGELRFPGLYQLQPGETLRQLITRVGGLTPEAYLFGSELTRERTRKEQQKRLDELIDRLGQEIERTASLKARSVSSPEEGASVKTQAESQRALIERMRQLRATGRIVLEIPPGKSAVRDLPDIVLEDADRVVIPSQPSTVNVFGNVYSQNAFLYRPEKRVEDYIAQAGGPTKEADEKSIYVVRADGSVVSRRQSSRFFGGFTSERLMPNDTIVVPENFERVTWIKELKDFSQIFSQFAIGVVGLKVLKGL